MNDFNCYLCKRLPYHLVEANLFKKIASHLAEGAGWKYSCPPCYKEIMKNEIEKINKLSIDFYAKFKVHPNARGYSYYIKLIEQYINDNYRN